MNKGTVVKIRLLNEHAKLPEYQTVGAAGADIFAAFDGPPIEIPPSDRALVSTGIALEIPIGMEGQVRPRSGLAVKHGITVLNAPGTIDSDYRGEVKVVLFNASAETFTVNSGDRIAQLVLAPVLRATFEQTSDLSETGRGSGGFGSTGHQ